MSRAKGKVFVVCAAFVALGSIASFVLVTSRMQGNQSMTKNETRPARLSDPRIVIKKRERILELYDGERLVKTYPVGLGFAPDGDKEKQGDGKTPEGDFYIFVKNPKSKFHLSLGLSYPSKEDAERGLAAGLITKSQHDQIFKAIDNAKMPPQQTALGGEIYIHGGGSDRDWTWGCIALTDGDIEEIYSVVNVGAKITIRQ